MPNKEELLEQFKSRGEIITDLTPRTRLVIEASDRLICVTAEWLTSMESEMPAGFSYWSQNAPLYFTHEQLDQAMDNYIGRLSSENPFHPYRPEGTLGVEEKHVNVLLDRMMVFSSHYDYLDLMHEPFWMEVFGKTATDSYCGGIVAAHGDKCYTYQYDWEKMDIPFHHGALLYLLSYTKMYPQDHERRWVCNWVIGIYPKYRSIIEKVEALVLKERFGVEPRVR